MIDTETQILGIIGYPLSHSLSPRLHNYYLEEYALNYVYLPFAVKSENIAEAVQGLKALNFRGINVTIPYKEKIMKYLDVIDEQARQIGAVNTVVNNDGQLYGYNTDASGFIRMLEEDGEFDVSGKNAVIIGAGGASKGVCFALCQNGVNKILILNRTEERAQKLAQQVRRQYHDLTIKCGFLSEEKYKNKFREYHLLVDTTPVGMSPGTNVEPVISPDYIHSDFLVVDLVYNPLETILLKEAKKKGAKTLNGMGMLLYQGIESFFLWTGIKPDGEISYKKLLR